MNFLTKIYNYIFEDRGTRVFLLLGMIFIFGQYLTQKEEVWHETIILILAVLFYFNLFWFRFGIAKWIANGKDKDYYDKRRKK